jgi:hypothetical protein
MAALAPFEPFVSPSFLLRLPPDFFATVCRPFESWSADYCYPAMIQVNPKLGLKAIDDQRYTGEIGKKGGLPNLAVRPRRKERRNRAGRDPAAMRCVLRLEGRGGGNP